MKWILFLIVGSSSLPAFSDNVEYPGPTRDLLCQQFDAPSMGLYFNREIRIHFETPTDVDMTLGLGLAKGLPRMLCFTKGAYLQFVFSSKTSYRVNGTLTCLIPKDSNGITGGETKQCESSDKKVSMIFDGQTNNIWFERTKYDCSWLPSH